MRELRIGDKLSGIVHGKPIVVKILSIDNGYYYVYDRENDYGSAYTEEEIGKYYKLLEG